MKENLSPSGLFMLFLFFQMVVAVNNTAAWIREPTTQTQDDPLMTPYFTPPGFPVYEKDILLGFYNPNADSETEIYISRSPDSDFTLAHIAGPGETIYYDTSRSPRTTYYFKLRAIKDDQVSAFSSVTAFTTGSKFYYPVLTAEATSTTIIELTLYDRSYDDNAYEVWREEGPGATLLTTIHASDSGRTFVFIDDLLTANTTYSYRVDARTKGPNNPFYNAVATASIQTLSGSEPSITSFTLVDPYTDEDLMELDDQAMIDAAGEPNIRANASPETSSVVFYLNGIKRTENEAPYAYFYDTNGDYKPGRLTKGHYILEATPFSGNNGQGMQGNTLRIEFSVGVDNLVVYGFTLVDPDTDEDIRELTDGDAIEAAGRPNIRANASSETKSVVFYLNGIKRTENQAPYAYFYDINGDYKPGHLEEGEYILEATAYSDNNGQGEKGNTLMISFTVENNHQQKAIASGEGIKTNHVVNFYPNPVVRSAGIEIVDHPGSNVLLEIYDQYGNNQSIAQKGIIDEGGYLKKELDVNALKKGNYIMLIRINDRIITRRFAVDK